MENLSRPQSLKAESGDVVAVVKKWFAKCLTWPHAPKHAHGPTTGKSPALPCGLFLFTSIFLRLVRLEEFWPALVAACQVHFGKAMPTNAIQGQWRRPWWSWIVKWGNLRWNLEKIMTAFKHFLSFLPFRTVQWVQPTAVNGCVDYSQGWRHFLWIEAPLWDIWLRRKGWNVA